MRVTPAIRLVAEGGRPITLRGPAVAAGLAGRLGAPVHVAWPDLRAPSIIAPSGATHANAWLRSRFQPEARLPPGVGAATWVAVRARGAVVGGRPGLAVGLAEQVLDRRLDRPQVVVWSASAHIGTKANAFVWEHGGEEPALVVRLLPDARRAHMLEREVSAIAAVRQRLGGRRDVSDVLPRAPLHSGVFGGLFMTAEALDPLGGAAAEDPRERAAAWLADLQRATASPAHWSRGDTEEATAKVARGWRLLRPDSASATTARVRARLSELEGQEVPRCVQHGDLWRGNVAIVGAAMRVYDWEWANLDAWPFLDLWTYDVAEHRHEALHGRGRIRPLTEARADVAAALRGLGVDERFAAATLAPAVAEVTFRSRWQDGLASNSERGSTPLMIAVEEHIAAP